jgi:hypothetical protein
MSARNHRCDAGCERSVGGIDEQLGGRRPASDEHRERRISVPSVHDGSTVDGQQIAFVENALAGMPWITSSFTDAQMTPLKPR